MTTARTFLFGIVLLIGLVVSTSASSVELDGNLVIQTKFGQIQGLTENGVDKWKGIPYAAPPNGQRRFALPVDPQPWTGVKKTTAPASICPQIHVLGHWLGNEDCLYANVYAPSNRTEPLPVFVWIYGGGWNFGDGIEFGLYEAENFVNANNVIVVTFNYRLGPLGFLSLPALKKEGQGSVGSYAIYDQIHLLQWVQNNIAAFGGEPNKVTIGGESAGAFSTCIHIASPLSKGLFRGAIMESGTCVSDIFFVDEERSFAWSENYIQHLGCDPMLPDSQVLQCIRSLDMGTVMAANMTGNTGFVPMMFPDMSWGATIDGQLLADTPFAIISSGQSNQVPLIAGTNQDEGTIFSSMFQDMVPSISNPLKFGDMEAIMNHFFGDNATVISMVQSIYPESAYANATLQVQTVIRDYFFLCPMSRALLAQSEFGSQTWLYQFVYQGHWIEDAFIGSDYHSAELEFVFNNPWPPLVHAFNARDQAMATSFGTYWSNFVKFQNPNGPADGSIKSNQPYWNPYEPTQLQSIAMDVPPSMTARLHEDRCQMWDKLAPWAPPLPKKMIRGRRKDRPIEFE